VSEERDFQRIIKSMYSADLPPVEIVTDKFRAVAKNFFSLPVALLMELKAAQIREDGSDLLLLFDAAEIAFEDDDFEKMKDLSIRDFLNVIHAWVNFDRALG
jgi:hypothetical protein